VPRKLPPIRAVFLINRLVLEPDARSARRCVPDKPKKDAKAPEAKPAKSSEE
jgi:hypothetical protein